MKKTTINYKTRDTLDCQTFRTIVWFKLLDIILCRIWLRWPTQILKKSSLKKVATWLDQACFYGVIYYK